jgi:thiopeptide-type bacteriocin biosynthesis protein
MARQPNEWLQVNVGLARPGGSALPSARVLLREINAALPRWRRDRTATRFFFQRKPPDLRLRFFGSRAALTARLRPLLARMKKDGHITKCFYSVYEPEERQFGGRECMALVHAYWDASSALWIALDRLQETGALRTSHADLMAAVLNDLFWSVLADSGEVWDTWCNLLALLQGKEVNEITPQEVLWLDSLSAFASGEEMQILSGYGQANAALSAGLLKAFERGRVRCGLRSILPYVGLFTLNRHGFDQQKATALAQVMAAAWNPKRHLRGARAEVTSMRQSAG